MRVIIESILLRNLANGEIGKVTLNMHADEVETILGQADVKGGTSRKNKWPCVWKYGDVELHFDREKKTLWLIFIESYSDEKLISGGNVFDFAKCELKFGMKKSDFLKITLNEGIKYSEEKDYNPGMIRISISKLSALFDENEKLVSISIMSS